MKSHIDGNRRLPLIPFVLLLLLAASAAQGIIIRHDRFDAQYVIDEAKYPQVFPLYSRFNNKVCAGTLIDVRWVITAAHCADETPINATLANGESYLLTIAGADYEISELVIHPEYPQVVETSAVDLALIKLDRAVGRVEPVSLYRDSDEQNRKLTLLGWGYTGIGTRGRSGNDGRLRRAENTVFAASRWLGFRFDDPRPAGNLALPLEGTPGLGDSGGPALLEIDDELFLLGVALGEVQNLSEPAAQGRYGAIALYERISSHYDWIMRTIRPDQP